MSIIVYSECSPGWKPIGEVEECLCYCPCGEPDKEDKIPLFLPFYVQSNGYGLPTITYTDTPIVDNDSRSDNTTVPEPSSLLIFIMIIASYFIFGKRCSSLVQQIQSSRSLIKL